MNIRRILYSVLILVCLGLAFVISQLLIYRNDINSNIKMISQCNSEKQYFQEKPQGYNYPEKSQHAIYNSDSCFCKMYSIITPKLLIYKAASQGKKLDFVKVGYENYILPTNVINDADLGITINDFFDDYLFTFEKRILYNFHKPIALLRYNIENNQSDNFITNLTNEILKDENNNYLTQYRYDNFEQVINEINKTGNKKIFLRINLEKGLYPLVSDIFRHPDNITGFTMLVMCESNLALIDFYNFSKQIEKDFVLVHRCGKHFGCVVDSKCKYPGENLSVPVFLTYINRNLIDKTYLPFKQDYSQDDDYKETFDEFEAIPKFSISWQIVLYEKIKRILKKDD